jgi:hypothetical protein
MAAWDTTMLVRGQKGARAPYVRGTPYARGKHRRSTIRRSICRSTMRFIRRAIWIFIVRV